MLRTPHEHPEGAATSATSANEARVETKTPSVKPLWELSGCIPKVGGTCYNFVYAPNNNSAVEALVEKTATTLGLTAREDEAFGYKGFATQVEMDDWLMANMNTTNIGVTFKKSLVSTWSDSDGEFQYELMVNTTRVSVGERERDRQRERQRERSRERDEKK